MQLAVSGHFDFASQHLQSLLSAAPETPIAFMQSDMSMSAIAMSVSADALIVEDAAISSATATAIADTPGASVSESAIKTANMVRKIFKRLTASKLLQ